MGRIALIAALVIALLALAGCGSSSGSGTSSPATNGGTSQAQSTICTALSNIRKHVSKLEGVTNGSVSVNDAAAAVQGLEANLTTIRQQAAKMSGTTRQNLQAANSAFSRQLNDIAQSVTMSSASSISTAAHKLATAAQQLGSAYRAAFSNLRC